MSVAIKKEVMDSRFDESNIFSHEIGQLYCTFNANLNTLLVGINYQERPCFNLDIINDITRVYDIIIAQQGYWLDDTGQGHRIKYLVTASGLREFFNTGGDLLLFAELIEKKDKPALDHYFAEAGRMFLALIHLSYELPITSIALLEGSAFGGGLEFALTHNLIFAEKGISTGFPEASFNLFPAGGAYNALVRSFPPARAQKLIIDNALNTTDVLYELGLAEQLAEKGQGMQAVMNFIQKDISKHNTRVGMQKLRHAYSPVTQKELLDMVNIWIDMALSLDAKSIKVLKRLGNALRHKVRVK